jgi:hypothetical protein
MNAIASPLRTTLALGLIAAGFVLDLVLVVLTLGEGVAMLRLQPVVAALAALGGGAMLVAGLTMVEPRRVPAGARAAQAFSG